MKRTSSMLRGGDGVRRSVLLISTVFAGAVIAAAATSVAVKVKQTSVRSDHQFFAPTLATARFTEQLSVLGQEQGWYHVRYGSVTGWVHSSAVSESVPSGGSASGALAGLGSALNALAGRPTQTTSTTKGYTEDEVALAGKGFNRNVEEQYRSRYPRADFAAVDKMEHLQADSEEIARFAKAGQLVADTQPVATTAPESRGGGLLSIFGNKGDSSATKGSGGSRGASPWDN